MNISTQAFMDSNAILIRLRKNKFHWSNLLFWKYLMLPIWQYRHMFIIAINYVIKAISRLNHDYVGNRLNYHGIFSNLAIFFKYWYLRILHAIMFRSRFFQHG